MKYIIREITSDREGHKEAIDWHNVASTSEAHLIYNGFKKNHPLARLQIVQKNGNEESVIRADYQEAEVDLDIG